MSCSNRRIFLKSATATILLSQSLTGATQDERARLRGLLWGSLIGDAAGGPVEFKPPSEVAKWMPGTRQWGDDERLDDNRLREIAASFQLLPYAGIRPQPAPYAHWLPEAGPGTVTDDSRHKFFLIGALRRGQQSNALPIDRRQLAEEYLRYQDSPAVQAHASYGPLCQEWLHEYNQAARWVLGERDLNRAAPVERLWGGVATNAGQMVLLPLAGAFAGRPEAAYRAAYQLGYMDNGTAKDLNSSIVAGLAAAVGQPPKAAPSVAWRALRETMLETDPYRYDEIPWVDRPIRRWLTFAEEAAARAEGSPKQLFAILEAEGQPRYHWDAHFVLASAWAILTMCRFDILASLQLSLDFGHDTDSAAQLVGAFGGAVAGEAIFPPAMRAQVAERLLADYAESVDDWADLLAELQNQTRYPQLVRGA